MTVFGMTDRGKFRAVTVDTTDGQGIQIDMPGGNPVGSASLVTSFSAEQRENFSVSQCLNGGIFLNIVACAKMQLHRFAISG